MSKKLSQAILNHLSNNNNLIDAIGEDGIYLIQTTDISKPSIVYNIKPIVGGIIKQSELEIKVIWNDPEIVLDIEEIIDNIFDMSIQTPSKLLLNNIILRSSRAGGGLIYNENFKMYENTLIYILQWRNQND